MWLLFGLLGIITAAIILAIADASKRKYDSGPYSSYASSMSSAMSGTYAALVAIGVILLLAGELNSSKAGHAVGPACTIRAPPAGLARA
jgi:hypothetical protein